MIDFKCKEKLRPLQQAAMEAVVRDIEAGHKRVMIVAPTGLGKCQKPDTPILMYDGSIKRADRVVVGDNLKVSVTPVKTKFPQLLKYSPEFPKSKLPHCCISIIFPLFKLLLDTPKLNPLVIPLTLTIYSPEFK